MSVVLSLNINEMEDFLKKSRYVIIYFYKKCDNKSQLLHARMRHALTIYPSTIVRYIEYYSFNQIDGSSMDSKYMMVHIYYAGRLIDVYQDPSLIKILKIFHAIYYEVIPVHFLPFVHFLNDSEIYSQTKTRPKPPKAIKNNSQENIKSSIKYLKSTKKINYCSNKFESQKNDEKEIIEAAAILCSFKNPTFELFENSLQKKITNKYNIKKSYKR